MTILQALILGLVQGLGEFLPISSSGHLKLAEHFLGLKVDEDLIAFDVLLHVATLVALVIYFRSDLRVVLGAWARSVPAVLRGGLKALDDRPDARIGWLVLLTMVPTGIVALALKDVFEQLSLFVPFVAVMLMVTGVLNWISDKRLHAEDFEETGKPLPALSWGGAVLIGLAQSVALIHGISRSGSTIAAGLGVGLDRESAPRFAFLMAIPAILGAAIVELPDLADGSTIGLLPAVVGFVAAMLTGYWALGTLFAIIRQGRLRIFAWYCWAVGAISLVLVLLGVGGAP